MTHAGSGYEDYGDPPEVEALRKALAFAQSEVLRLVAHGAEQSVVIQELQRDGPRMKRGTNGDGTVWMGTMREVLEDYKQAADIEARHADELRKELEVERNRMNWLARNMKSSTVYMDGQHPYQPNHRIHRLRGPTFRAAVDAAMKEGG